MSRVPEDAFSYYVSLGPERSYSAVASHYGVSKRAITNRASNEDWQQRLTRIEAQARERADQAALETIEQMNERHLKTMRIVQAKALDALRQLPLSSAHDAVNALDKAVKAERVIRGEPGERTQHSVEEVTKRELERWLEPEQN